MYDIYKQELINKLAVKLIQDIKDFPELYVHVEDTYSESDKKQIIKDLAILMIEAIKECPERYIKLEESSL